MIIPFFVPSSCTGMPELYVPLMHSKTLFRAASSSPHPCDNACSSRALYLPRPPQSSALHLMLRKWPRHLPGHRRTARRCWGRRGLSHWLFSTCSVWLFKLAFCRQQTHSCVILSAELSVKLSYFGPWCSLGVYGISDGMAWPLELQLKTEHFLSLAFRILRQKLRYNKVTLFSSLTAWSGYSQWAGFDFK